ncbi:MAG: monovalent cation/H(+) antiporter subunit G [Phycisphaeraceae bacterium]|nr:MAG: monovalent cation/H(+) antiporter subunit G [Phycisphaeraceae bacterium]
MKDILAGSFFILGGLFSLLAGLGILRMPDSFTRMQAATKAGTLGVGCLILGVAIYFADLGDSTRALLVIGFLFLTAPVAAYIIARAAYHIGVPLWSGTVIDELKDSPDRGIGEDDQIMRGAGGAGAQKASASDHTTPNPEPATGDEPRTPDHDPDDPTDR